LRRCVKIWCRRRWLVCVPCSPAPTDPAVRGHAAWALGQMGVQDAARELASLATDTSPLDIYLGGCLRGTTVGALARAARARFQTARLS
jgi:HEAT repeat protein